MNSREKIMEMVKDGTLSVEEGLRLLDAIEESENARRRRPNRLNRRCVRDLQRAFPSENAADSG